MRKSNQTNYLEKAFGLIPCAIFTVDREKIITSVNDTACRIIGYPREEIIGQPCSLFCVGPCQVNCNLLDESVGKPIMNTEGIISTKEGEALIVFKKIDYLRDDDGNIVGGIETFEDVTEFKRAQEALREREERYRDLLENASDLIQCVDFQGRFVYVNKTWKQTLGYTDKDIKNITLTDIISSDYLNHCQQVLAKLKEGQSITGLHVNFIGKDGRVIEVEGNVTCRWVDGQPVSTRGIFRDVTKRKCDQQALRESTERYRTLFEKTNNPIFIIDVNGNYIDCNEAASRFLECSREEVLRKNVLDTALPGKEDKLADYRPLWEEGGTIEREYYINRRVKVLELTVTPAYLQGEKVVFGMGKDITQSKQAEEKVQYLAYYDSLTDLPNRVSFLNRLGHEMSRAKRINQPLAILFLDLDRFKTINDTLGHGVGDKLLQAVARRLKGCIRKNDMVSRLGGDEFILLLPEIRGVEEATAMAERLLEHLGRAIKIGKREFHITPSIGIALYPDDGEDAETLLRNADTAMYRAKEQGRNNYQLYHPAMSELAEEKMELENKLRHALENEEFVIYYQPQVNVESGRIVGMEALIRWENPSFGLVPPGNFIPVAEETGLIIPLGEWLLRKACAQSKAWQDMGLSPIRLAVNLSSRQFRQQDFPEVVGKILEETGLNPQYLELEITETTAIGNMEYTIKTINRLKQMGIRLSIDDFGTGYASLKHLKLFPPLNSLKIDRSFIKDIDADSDNTAKALVATMIVLAKNFKLEVIAEGVETREQLDYLKKYRCDEIQGYFFSEPLLPKDFFRLLVSQPFTSIADPKNSAFALSHL